MASSILECLNFTWDTPNDNQNMMMPVLYTMVWIGRETRTWGVPGAMIEPDTVLPVKQGTLKLITLYSFYRNPMAGQDAHELQDNSPSQFTHTDCYK